MKDRIKLIRKDTGLSQTLFGKRVGVSLSAVQKWEMGIAEPSDAVILLLCREFQINEGWLRDGIGEMKRPKSREAALGEGIRKILVERPDSFQANLLATLLKYDPDGPEWKVIESIFRNVVTETKKDREP